MCMDTSSRMEQRGDHTAACGTDSAGIAKKGCESALLQLPSPLLERIVLSCGSQGAGACCSCRAVAEALHAVATPAGAARYLIARYGPHAAVQHVYGCPGLLKAVTRGAPRRSHDALALGLLRALCEGGCGAGGQTDAVLVPAAAAGHVAVAQWAMQEGATAHDRALRAACTHGHTEMVLLLLGALGAGRQEAQATCREGESGEPLPLLLSTVLGDAATCGDKGVVELLLEAGADAQHDHSRALRNAATWGNEEALAALLAAGADPRPAQGRLLLAAARHGHSGVVRQLLAAGANAAANDNVALCVAAQYGHEEVVSELLAAGADGSARDSLPLYRTAWRGREGIVRQLLDMGVPYTAHEGRALLAATKEGHAGVVKMLLEAGPWPQDTLDTALRMAKYLWWFEPPAVSAVLKRGRQEAAQALEAAGATTGMFDTLWMRALLEALVGGAVEAFRQVVPEPSGTAVIALVTVVVASVELTMCVPLWLVSKWVRKAMSAAAR